MEKMVLENVIAIDGGAGKGKTTVGRLLAKALNWPELDTGMLYRALAFVARNRCIDHTNVPQCVDIAKSFAQRTQNMGLACAK